MNYELRGEAGRAGLPTVFKRLNGLSKLSRFLSIYVWKVRGFVSPLRFYGLT